MEEYVHVDDSLEVTEMLDYAEIASMMVDTTGNNKESEDECDVIIIRPTKPVLKAALKVIQSHLL